MVKTILKLNAVPKPDDTADALAVAICHANSSSGSSRLAASIEKALAKEAVSHGRGYKTAAGRRKRASAAVAEPFRIIK